MLAESEIAETIFEIGMAVVWIIIVGGILLSMFFGRD